MKKYQKFVYSLTVVFILELVACPAIGQELIQKHIKKEDYKLWSSLSLDKFSRNAKWISYYLNYESGHDTLFVKNIFSQRNYAFARCFDGRFSDELFFACRDYNKDYLHILDLHTGNKRKIESIKKYDFSADGRFLITLESKNNNSSRLSIRNNKGELLFSVENTQNYVLNVQGNALLLATREKTISSVQIISLERRLTNRIIILKTSSEINSLTWSKNSKSTAFYTIKNGSCELNFYDRHKNNLSVLKSLPSDLFIDKIIKANSSVPLKISDDNNSIFFCYTDTNLPKINKSIPEIWDSNDKYLYSAKKIRSENNRPFLAVWHPTLKLARPISTSTLPWTALTSDQQHAVLADPSQYEPQYDVYGPMDYFLINTISGEKEVIVKHQSGYPSLMNFSPDGRFICFYKNNNWMLYNIKEKRQINATETVNTSFECRKEDAVWGQNNVYGFQGWSSDGKSFLVADEYDIWQVFVNGNMAERITRGFEKKIRFRLVLNSQNSSFNYSGAASLTCNLLQENILEAYDTFNVFTGYFILNSKKQTKPLIFNNSLHSKILKAENKNAYIFQSENFSKPRAILFRTAGDTAIKTLVNSNPQQKHFCWGHSEIIHYRNSKKKILNGVLFYPACYNPSLKYPMIVHIYERQSQRLNQYEIPTYQSKSGFNVQHYTTNGYFVFMPDIEYEMGEPGISAADCVENAVKHIIEKEIIDSGKIGLIGHSFGAYETNFILTQSDLFAAAVSGSGISDNVFINFTVRQFSHIAEAWRFENQQYRMGTSLYENMAAYIRNSPLLNAKSISTPILIWTGKNDSEVNTDQSTAFYLALRRLNKKTIMLKYPDEGHVISSPTAKEDLTNKVMEWFDYYLKKGPIPYWMQNNKKENQNL